MDSEVQKRLDDLQKQIDDLRVKRIHEHDILPGEIKSKHISEGVKWIRSGITANKPTSGEDTDYGGAIYYDTTANKLYIWNTVSKTWRSANF